MTDESEMKSFDELCQDERVQERLNRFGYTLHNWHCPYCAKDVGWTTKQIQPTLTDLWQWWCEVNKGVTWMYDFQALHHWFRSAIMDNAYVSLEHALLACILERLDKEENDKTK